MSVGKRLATALILAFLAGVCWAVYLYESGEVEPEYATEDGGDSA